MRLYLLFVLLIFFSSCISNDFKVLESTGNNPGIQMELKQRRGIFGREGEFELKLINNANTELRNCRIEFNTKYSHTINGLHISEKGLYKSDIFPKGDTLIIPFTENVENIFFFNVPEEGFKKETIGLICDECNVQWRVE